MHEIIGFGSHHGVKNTKRLVLFFHVAGEREDKVLSGQALRIEAARFQQRFVADIGAEMYRAAHRQAMQRSVAGEVARLVEQQFRALMRQRIGSQSPAYMHM